MVERKKISVDIDIGHVKGNFSVIWSHSMIGAYLVCYFF
jgi:hypothetical protein